MIWVGVGRRDGRWIYFGSTRIGNGEVWRLPAKEARLSRLPEMAGMEAFESLDRKFIYYTKIDLKTAARPFGKFRWEAVRILGL